MASSSSMDSPKKDIQVAKKKKMPINDINPSKILTQDLQPNFSNVNSSSSSMDIQICLHGDDGVYDDLMRDYDFNIEDKADYENTLELNVNVQSMVVHYLSLRWK
jgi:hypothetical protein